MGGQGGRFVPSKISVRDYERSLKGKSGCQNRSHYEKTKQPLCFDIRKCHVGCVRVLPCSLIRTLIVVRGVVTLQLVVGPDPLKPMCKLRGVGGGAEKKEKFRRSNYITKET